MIYIEISYTKCNEYYKIGSHELLAPQFTYKFQTLNITNIIGQR